ncbi:MAG TPA: aldo/keto reductase [Trebonia sp.]|jgi:aryl-alcohol dehydrogenase-like predicted oxidoreductase|nr:aldo/keto reductase [Trebonia sp.]
MRYLNIDTAKPISKIGLGTWQFGSRKWGYGEAYSQRTAISIVRRAVELGVTLFDTAEIYAGGRSERILGGALGDDRESVCIAGKLFPLTPTGPLVRQRAKASASRLGVSRLDLYQVHYPNPLGDDRAIMNDMRLLQHAGLVGEVGVSAYSVERWESAELALGSRVLSNQVQYSLVSRGPERAILPFAQEHGRVVIAFSPLAHGLLSGRYNESNLPTDRVRSDSPYFQPDSLARTTPLLKVLREVADAHSATPAQIALAWVIRHPAVAAIPGASSIEQLESNVSAVEIELSDDEDRALRESSSWSCAPELQPSPVHRDLEMFRHTLRVAPYLAGTAWNDFCRALSRRASGRDAAGLRRSKGARAA